MKDKKKVTVKQKGWWWYLPPFCISGRNRYSSTIGHTIYLTPKRWKSHMSGNPSRGTNALIEHEVTHIIQQERYGSFKWMFLYLFSKKKRILFESEAYAYQVISYEPKGKTETFNYVQKRAKSMASWRYFMSITQEDAYILIMDNIAKIRKINV